MTQPNRTLRVVIPSDGENPGNPDETTSSTPQRDLGTHPTGSPPGTRPTMGQLPTDSWNARSRISPSWAVVATSRPSRVKKRPRTIPRAPEAAGLSTA